ncbi:MAG: hypothetical protein Q8Q73_02425 [Stagnimonas sp.]|nr:hypothetical protein [Stagnimonas sp.]
MSTLEARAEAVKLARLLAVDPETLACTETQAAAQTRAFRVALTESLFDQHRSGFQRLAGLAKLLPAALTAKLAEKALGAMVAGRVAGEMEPGRAVEIAKHLPAPFLADLTVQLDPQAAAEVVGRMPVEIVLKAALELVRRADYITMARFVDVLAEPALRAVIEAIPSDEALLHIGFFVENSASLRALAGLLPERRLLGTLRAAHERGIWPEVLALIEHLGPKLQGHYGDLLADEPPAMLDSLLAAAQAHGFWTTLLLPFLHMRVDNQKRLVAVLGAGPYRAEIEAAARADGSWAKLEPMFGAKA